MLLLAPFNPVHDLLHVQRLLWLPIEYCMKFKIANITLCTLHSSQPASRVKINGWLRGVGVKPTLEKGWPPLETIEKKLGGRLLPPLVRWLRIVYIYYIFTDLSAHSQSQTYCCCKELCPPLFTFLQTVVSLQLVVMKHSSTRYTTVLFYMLFIFET